jgi:glycosyltransferase involved in cell wall biosynthesis
MKTISVIAPCFNEQDNVEELYERVRNVMVKLGRYRYEHIFIDNASTDKTVEIVKRLAQHDHNVKLIVNARNFGHIRSPMHALFQATGDAVIGMASDLQDPPEMIEQLIEKWEQGYPMVLCIKKASNENRLVYWIRSQYYRLINFLSSVETFENFTGFGLYDRRVVDIVKSLNDPYPYFRGMIAEIGLPHAEIVFHQPRRLRGVTKNNLYSLYDLAMLAITNLSRVPLRLITALGFATGGASLLIGFGYLIYKLLFWNTFNAGIAPALIGLFFFGSVQLITLGIVGEYVGAIHTQVQKRPYVVERERVNFEHAPGEARQASAG